MSVEKKKSIDTFFELTRYFHWLLLALVTVVFLVILYPHLVVKHHDYRLGDVAEKDIKASHDFFIEDHEATLARRRQAAMDVLTVYDHDTTLLPVLAKRVTQAFAEVAAVFEKAEADRLEASKTLDALGTGEDATFVPLPVVPEAVDEETLHELVMQKKEGFENSLGIPFSRGAFKILESERFSSDIADLIARILTEVLENGVVANKELLLQEADKGIVLRDIHTQTDEVVRRLKRIYGLDQSKAMVRIIGDPLLEPLNYNLRNLVVDVVQRLIHPNITLNKNETAERRRREAESIKPILYQIKTGEMLLREGERVTGVTLLKLKAASAQPQNQNLLSRGVGALMIIVSLLLVVYALFIQPDASLNRHRNKNLFCLVALFLFLMVFVKVSAVLATSLTIDSSWGISDNVLLFGLPLAAGAMIVCLFMGLEIAFAFALVTAAATAITFQGHFEVFLYFFLSSLLAAHWVVDCRERKVIIKAGAKVGLVNILLAVAGSLYLRDPSGIDLAWSGFFAFLGGIAAGIVTVGLAPLIELLFNYTTDISLLEMANLERPILRKLMLEAPGTYHHSVIVGSMVEAAAAEIGANPLLAKVCGYYHDIGKIRKPLYFIENQRNGVNRHDKLAPSMSSLILIAHIKNGVEIAKQLKLGHHIIDTIQQHHGTSLIKYFYERAKQRKGADAVNPDAYRYPGPKPQTKEAGLVMLADVVEAASRTLENPTPARIQGLVQNLTNKIFSDGQLDNCELTLKDLHNIAKSFNKILNGIHHHRIEYPDAGAAENGKTKNGSPHKKQSKTTQDLAGQHPQQSTGHLKRLGLS